MKALRTLALVLFIQQAGVFQAQEPVPVLQPSIGGIPDLSSAHFALYEWYNKVMSTEIELEEADKARFDSLYHTVGETRDSPCQVIGMECSWYCGGGPDTVWASSTLDPQGAQRHAAFQAHDLDYCTAWSEGVPGPGIGESLTYRFAPDSPRIHTIIISNGRVTNDTTWKANNRVKRLRVSENSQALLDLDLADTMADQSFSLPRLLGQRADGEAMVLTFTIIDVYAGERHDDTVITEIYFDGTDVH